MTLITYEIKILKIIENEVRIQQNDLLCMMKPIAQQTVLNHTSKLIEKKLIFDYKINGKQFYELPPFETFHKNLEIQIKNRIKDLITILKKINSNSTKYGPIVLANLYENLSLHSYNPIYFTNDLQLIINEYKSFNEFPLYRENLIKKISILDYTDRNMLGVTIKMIAKTHQKCNKLHDEYMKLTQKRNRIRISNKRLVLDEKIIQLYKKYMKLHNQFYDIEKLYEINIEKNDDFEKLCDYHPSNVKHNVIISKKLNKLKNYQKSDIHKEILNIIEKYGDGVTRQLIIDSLVNQRNICAENTIIKYIEHLINDKIIRSVRSGKNFVYYMENDKRSFQSEKQIKQIIKEWIDVFTIIIKKFSKYEIMIQREILIKLNNFFTNLNKFQMDMFKKYDKHDENNKYELLVTETFKTILMKTNVIQTLKKISICLDQIDNMLSKIGKTPPSTLSSNRPMPKYLINYLTILRKNKNELKKLSTKKLEFSNLKLKNLFDDIFTKINYIINSILRKPISDIDNYHKTYRDLRFQLINLDHVNDRLDDIAYELIATKTNIINGHDDEINKFNQLLNELLSFVKYQKNYKIMKNLINHLN